jgi:hypothetical protein
MVARRRLIVAIAFLLSVGLSACSSRKHEEGPQPPDKPVDRLAPNEVVEGKERAFGLPLPRDIRVKARFPTTVHVESPLAPGDVTNFFSARVKNGKVVPGASLTTLTQVSPVAEPAKQLIIEVRGLRRGDGTRTEMVIRDVTAPPVETGLSNEQRWEKAGLTPTGKIMDPKHLQ